MSGLASKYQAKISAIDRSSFEKKVAIIVGEETQLRTQPIIKFPGAGPADDPVYKQVYKIRIFGEDPLDKPVDRLPVAYPLVFNGGGAFTIPTPRYAANTIVEVSKDPVTSLYFIERVMPKTYKPPLLEPIPPSVINISGFVPGSNRLPIPETYRLNDAPNGKEQHNNQSPSEADEKDDADSETPPIKTACKPVNTEAINKSVQDLVDKVTAIKEGAIGPESFLSTSQKFFKDAQSTISGATIANIGIGTDLPSTLGFGGSDPQKEMIAITLGNAAGDISRVISSLVQQVRKWVLRKLDSLMNEIIGNIPLSARYIGNEITDQALSAISCLFIRVMRGLENMVKNILETIINKVVNAAQCLVENILTGIVGNVLGNLIGGINSILGSIAGAIGSVINFTSELLDFVISILDFAKCPVKNVCPEDGTWDFVGGSRAPKPTIDFNNVFEGAKGLVSDISNSVGDIKATFDNEIADWSFTNADGTPYDPLGNFNAGTIFQSIVDGKCNVGPVDCGPPNVVFFGGGGSGGAGNPVINAIGEVLGVDIILPGQYTSPPVIDFVDNCGNGKGANGEVILDDDGGIANVVIINSGYDYEGFPYGDKGAGGKVWADRCQTVVFRANYDWSLPYSNGATITAFYGDTVTLPGQDPVVIDENFTEDMIPGCVVTGVNPKLKDMTSFDYTYGKVYDYGIRHQFGLDVDAQRAFAEGFTEQDIRFFLENKFFLRVGPKMREKLLDPNWGRIPEFSVTFTAPGCPPGTPEDPNEPPTVGYDGDGSDVVSVLDGVVILDPGFGFSDGDTIEVDGDNGAELEPVFTNGSLTGVNIINPGIGYTELPEIKINTRTGFNARVLPVLRFVDPNDDGFVVPPGTPVLQVIDCVGKV